MKSVDNLDLVRRREVDSMHVLRLDRGDGGAIDLVMHIHGINFKAAAKLLKERDV